MTTDSTAPSPGDASPHPSDRPGRPDPRTDADRWAALPQRLPDWFRDAPLGIFIHWGAYSVPAWAEPIGELGSFDNGAEWMAHNPYAEWYANTIRIDGSPAQQHHREVHGDAPYDDFLDAWGAEDFDAAAWADLFRRAGADYVIPTTKHHDGITLWDAPGTGDRNTVRRGPHRDLVGEIAEAARAAGLRFGTYYSGGLDWHERPTDPIDGQIGGDRRPTDDAYGVYCSSHVRDLIQRYHPDVFWNDIGWPDENHHFGPGGLGELLEHFYAEQPEGLINDRFSGAHHDFVTTEYQSGSIPDGEPWEQCRGVGLSFGYNQVEGPEQYMTPAQAVRHLLDAVSKGGRLLLNVGPTAAGVIPPLQVAVLEGIGQFMDRNKARIAGATGLGALEIPGVEWARAVQQGDRVHVYLSGPVGTREIEPAALPAAGDWGTEPVVVELHGEDAMPSLISAPAAAGASDGDARA